MVSHIAVEAREECWTGECPRRDAWPRNVWLLNQATEPEGGGAKLLKLLAEPLET